MPTIHEPVLLKEVLDLLRPQPGETFIDGTFGGGGASGGNRRIGRWHGSGERDKSSESANQPGAYGSALKPPARRYPSAFIF